MKTLAYSLQFVLTEKEYAVLLRKLHASLSAKLPPPEEVAKTSVQQYVRRHLRLFAKVWAVLSVVNQAGRLRATREPLAIPGSQVAASVTAVSGLYKLAFTILSRVSCSKYAQAAAPLLSGLIAGCAFQIFPKQSGRATIGVYMAAKAAEFAYNQAQDAGYMDWKPKWLGSWVMFPVSMAQLFHTFIFHPECCPTMFKRLMMRFSDGYIPPAPVTAAANWPTPDQIVESIAEISTLHYPPFASPVLYPTAFSLHPKLAAIEPVVSMAHPAITSLTSAVTHPRQPSELSALGNLVATKFASASRYVFLLYAVFGLLKRRDVKALYPAIGKTVRTTLFLTMSAATCWGGINFSQKLLGRTVLPLYRYRLIGASAGLWALLDMHSRTRYIYAARMAIMSWWDVMVKTKKVKSFEHGDVALLAVSLGVIMMVMEQAPGSVSGAGVRKCLHWMKTGEFVDPSVQLVAKEIDESFVQVDIDKQD